MDHDGKERTPAPAPAAPRRPGRRASAARGLVLGALVGFGLQALHLSTFFGKAGEHFVPLCAGICLLLGLARACTVGRWVGAAVVILYLLVGYTPVARVLVKQVERNDATAASSGARASAVIVLGSSLHRDGSFTSDAQDRALQGYALLK